MLRGKNILVTGGLGFIGSRLVSELKKDNNVEIADIKMNSIESVLSSLQNHFDIIYHLGMPSSAPMMDHNVTSFCQVIRDFDIIKEYCEIVYPRLVIASTSSLYRKCPIPNNESFKVEPFDYYTLSRYNIELMSKDLDSICLRLFSVYGGDEAKGKYANVITQMKKGYFEIYGDGTQTRDFIHVDDVVRAFIIAGESDKRGVYNVGTGVETSFNEIAKLTDCRCRYIDNPIEKYVYRTCADTTKTERDLGFKAKVCLSKEVVFGC